MYFGVVVNGVVVVFEGWTLRNWKARSVTAMEENRRHAGRARFFKLNVTWGSRRTDP